MAGTGIHGGSWATPGPDRRKFLATRISESETFRRSSRLKSMLLHLCDRGFDGHPEELTEQQIGVAVFGRPAAYDSANDNVVRVAARQLRIKLQEYYNTEGRLDQEILVIPKGTYVPEVLPRESAVVPSDAVPETTESRKIEGLRPAWRISWPGIGIAASIIAVLAAGAAVWNYQKTRDLKLEQQPLKPYDNLIKAIALIPGRRTLVVLGDPNLAAFAERTGAEVSLEHYLAGRIPSVLPTAALSADEERDWLRILSKPQVDTANLSVLTRVLQANPADSDLVTVQHAAEVRGPEFRTSNVVLVGNPMANPWMELVVPSLNFQMFYDRVKKAVAIRNREPRPGEPAQFSGTEVSGRGLGFAQLAMRPNISQGAFVLLLAGTTDEALMAAADFACNQEALPRLCALLGIDNLQQTEAFEIVLRVDSLAGISREVRAVAHRATLRSKP